MPPRAQRLYPRMKERPLTFRLNPNHFLFNDLCYALLGYIPGSATAFDGDGSNAKVLCNGQVYLSSGYTLDKFWAWCQDLGRFLTYRPSGDHWIEVPYYSIFDFGSTVDFTLAAWVHPLSVTNNWNFGWSQVGTPADLFFSLQPGYLRVHTPTSRFYEAGSVELRLGHVAVYVNAGTLTIQQFTDGIFKLSLQVGSWNVSNKPLLIGRSPVSGSAVPGWLGDILLWRGDKRSFIPFLANSDAGYGGFILPPRRRLWPVAPVAEYIKRRQLGLRVGSREAVI